MPAPLKVTTARRYRNLLFIIIILASVIPGEEKLMSGADTNSVGRMTKNRRAKAPR